mgnify:FL=1
MRWLAVVPVAILAAPAPLAASVTSGMLLTNFVSATFSLPGGSGVSSSGPGVSMINIPNSASTWVLVTDSPQLCMKGWKVALGDPNGTRLSDPPSVYPGDLLCFEIGFSNCGGLTMWSVTLNDALPANVVKAPAMPGNVWVQGGYSSISVSWATSLGGPWYSSSDAGQAAPMHIRWILGKVGMNQTGYVRYCVTVL